MASSSASISHSESNSDTYIPEYSQTPVLMEIAQHARAMSDYVYNWGMDRFNKQQGDIDGLMRDALSYASPQRIAVDMGMAEAGVQMAAERGRLSAIRDMQSYGIDMSSGKALHEAMAARNTSSIAAAGAGNQQRMADQAAGNAMRNQAIAAGLQNANFGLGVGNQANAYLQTASSLKYPPLGRYSNSVSDSESRSIATDPPKSPETPKEPKQEQAKPDGSGKAPAEAKPKQEKPVKPPPKDVPKPKKPGEEEEDEEKPEPEDGKMTIGAPTTEPFNDYGLKGAGSPFNSATDPTGEVSGITPEMQSGPYANMGIGPNGEVPAMGSGSQTANWPDWNPATNPNTSAPPSAENMGVGPDGSTPAVGSASQTPNWPDPTQPAGPGAQSGMDMDFNPWANNPDQGEPNPAGGVERGPDLGPVQGDDQVMSEYNPYQDNIQTAAFQDNQGQIDPVTGEPVDNTETNTSDPAGSLYGIDPSGGGDWSLDVEQPTAADWGETTDFGAQTGTYDSAYDNWTDPDTGAGFQLSDYQDTGGDFQTEDPVDPNATDFGPEGQWDYEYEDQQPAPDSGAGDEGQWDYEYDDQNQDDYSYDDSDYAYDDGSDYEDDYEYDDAGDDSYDDYADDDYADDDYADDGEDDDYYEDDTGGDYEDSGDDGEYARGGPVRQRRGSMGPRRPMPTGYQPTMMQRPGRMTPPPQPPRAMRGAPMPARGGPRPPPMGRGMGGPGAMAPGNFISANGMPAPSSGGMPRPQRMAGGGAAGRRPEPTQGGFVSRELSPSGGSKVDDVEARLNAGEFVIPKDVATWKGKEFFYKMIAQARKMRSGEGNSPGNSPSPQNNSPRPQNNSPRPQTGYSRGMR